MNSLPNIMFGRTSHEHNEMLAQKEAIFIATSVASIKELEEYFGADYGSKKFFQGISELNKVLKEVM